MTAPSIVTTGSVAVGSTTKKLTKKQQIIMQRLNKYCKQLGIPKKDIPTIVFTKEEFMAWSSPDFPKSEKFRVIYENEEIGVTHEFLSFQSGKEAVLCAWSI